MRMVACCTKAERTAMATLRTGTMRMPGRSGDTLFQMHKVVDLQFFEMLYIVARIGGGHWKTRK